MSSTRIPVRGRFAVEFDAAVAKRRLTERGGPLSLVERHRHLVDLVKARDDDIPGRLFARMMRLKEKHERVDAISLREIPRLMSHKN